MDPDFTNTIMEPCERGRDLLLVEDDASLQNQMQWALADSFTVHIASSRVEAMDIVRRYNPPIVVLDLGLPPDASGVAEGLSILAQINEANSRTKVIVASGNAQRTNALRAVAAGAYDYISKPVDMDQLKLILERAWHLYGLEEDNARLKERASGTIEGIIAASTAMQEVCRLIERIAPTDVSVLILGESGTGKDVVARALHRLSFRHAGAFVAVNCAATPEALLEIEFFGHERGAFTGAEKQVNGKVERADGGTLFLDEIGDMPLALQVKLLRFLQNHTFQRVGGHTDIKVDARIVSASNRDIKGMIRTGTFREDLFFRLDEITVMLPSLREREGDAILIAQSLLQRFSRIYKKRNLKLAPSALLAITRYAWPGNVRELENRIKRAVVLTENIQISHVDMDFSSTTGGELVPISLKEVRRAAELSAIQAALSVCNYNLSRTSKLLGVSRPTLYSLIAGHSIKLPPKRDVMR